VSGIQLVRKRHEVAESDPEKTTETRKVMREEKLIQMLKVWARGLGLQRVRVLVEQDSLLLEARCTTNSWVQRNLIAQ